MVLGRGLSYRGNSPQTLKHPRQCPFWVLPELLLLFFFKVVVCLMILPASMITQESNFVKCVGVFAFWRLKWDARFMQTNIFVDLGNSFWTAPDENAALSYLQILKGAI